MFTFKSPVVKDSVWTLCFRPQSEMTRLYYEDKNQTEAPLYIFGLTDFLTHTIYLDERLTGPELRKTLMHELTHMYLWETGQEEREEFSLEDVCDLFGSAANVIHETFSTILFRLKEGLYKV